jgi:rhodanese-related sulfurtransferase
MPTVISRDEIRSGQGSLTVVDALPQRAYRRRHLPGALNLTEEEVADRAAEVLPDRAAPIVVYSTDDECTRAPDLAARLEELGYTDVRLYAAGIEDWADAGLPLDRA